GHFDRRTTFKDADRPTHVVDVHDVETFPGADAYRLTSGKADSRVVAPVGPRRGRRHVTPGAHQALAQGNDPLVVVPTADQDCGSSRPDNQHQNCRSDTEQMSHELTII